MKYHLGMLLLLPSLLIAQQFDGAIEASRSSLESLLSEIPGISVAVGHQDGIIWSEGFGYADAAAGEQVTSDHRFAYYSLSKSITGFAVHQLAKDQQIDLDTSILSYDAELPDHYGDVTMRLLLNHSAGVRHYNKGEWMKISSDNCDRPKQALETFINDPLTQPAGTAYRYSSFGYVLLSHLIEKVAKRSFDTFVEATLFESRSIESIERVSSPKRLDLQAAMYQKWNAKKETGKLAIVDNSCKFGGGGFIGTASDLALLHLKVLAEETATSPLYQPINPDLSNYAYGLGINTTKGGDRYGIHTGSGMGGSAVLLLYPEHKLCVVILGNIKSDALKNIVGKIGKPFLDAVKD